MKLKLQLKGKLILFVSILIAFTMLVQSTISYIKLDKAYDSIIEETEKSFDSIIKISVENVISVLEVNYKRYTNGEITEQEALENAERIVRDARYNDGNGYFWADSENGKCVVHMNSEYEGTERFDVQDLKGNFYIRNIINIGNQGGGFTEFYFSKPNEEGTFKKRAYTRKFEPYGWYISTGNYYEDIDLLVDRENHQKTTDLLSMVASGIFIFILGVVFMYIMAGSITKPLKLVTKRIELLSEGDLNTPVPLVNTHDETNVLANAASVTIDNLRSIINDITSHLHEMSIGNMTYDVTKEYKGDFDPIKKAMTKIYQDMNDTLSSIKQSADFVNSGAEQLAISSQEISQGATEQASSIEELAATICDISEQVKGNADHASSARELAIKAGMEVGSGNNKMKQLVIAMDDINNSSKEISKIIKVIDEIAFQTNILALNAAVEAARAGSAGKGFVVVADEVRNLAAKSAEAARETTVLIENSIKKAEEGTKIADFTAKSLQEIVQSVGEVSDLILQIDDASVQQSSSLSQVTQGVEQISSVVQTNSAIAEESAATSEELSGQANMLDSMISNFKLKNDELRSESAT